LLIFDFWPANGCLVLVNKLSSIFGWLRPCLPAGKFGWRCQQNSDYQPVGLRFASLPALSSLEPKRNLPDGSQGSPAGGQGLISYQPLFWRVLEQKLL
jgi:hypothetical protein